MGLFNGKNKKKIEKELDLSTLTEEERFKRDVEKYAAFLGSDDVWFRFEKARDVAVRLGDLESAQQFGEYAYVVRTVNSVPLDIVNIKGSIVIINIEDFFTIDVQDDEEFDFVQDFASQCMNLATDKLCDFFDEHNVDFGPYEESAAMKIYYAVVQTLFEEKYDFAFYNIDIEAGSGKKINVIKEVTLVDVEVDGKTIPCIWCSHEHKKYNPSIPNSEVAVIIDGPDIKYGFVSNVRKVASCKVDEMHYVGGINFKKAYHVADEIVPRYTQLQCIMAIARRRGI